MAKPRLHLDADTSIRALQQALIERGHDVTRTPTLWAPLNATDEQQLLGATAQGRVIFAFNIRDFQHLAAQYPHHAGIVLAAQRRWRLPMLIGALDRLLTETNSAFWVGQTHWLNHWRQV